MAAHPSIASMLQNPYGVLSEYTDPDGQTYPGIYATAVNSLIPTFQGHFDLLLDKALLQSARNGRIKEWNYINTFLKSIEGLEDYKIYKDLIALCDALKQPLENKTKAVNSISKIVDTIQKIKTGLYDLDKTLEENEKTFKEFNKIAATQPISSVLRKVLNASGSLTNLTFGKIDINKTGKEIIDEAMNEYTKIINEAIEKNGFNDKQIQILLQLVEVFRIKLENFYENKLTNVTSDPLHKSLFQLEQDAKQYDTTKTNNKEKIMMTKNGKNKTISQVVWDTINGVLGGKGIEYVIDLSGGGINTGSVKNLKGKDIDADNIQLASGKLSFYYSKSNNLFEKTEEMVKFEDLKKDIKAIDNLDRRFIIMTSAKDQSTNAKFTDFYAKSDTVKIKGDGSLASRKAEIEEMYYTIGNVGHNPSDLVFSIANLAEDFVCSGQVEQAKRTLGAICIAWMFDDAQEIVQGTQFIEGSDSLHFYNLNGKYYTLSDILQLTAEDLSRKSLLEYTNESSDGMKYVRVNITVPKTNPYEAMLKRKDQPPEGMGQWEEVAKALNSSTKIGIRMSPQNLFKDLFGSLFGV